MAVECLIRLFSEILYIKDIEQRDLTSEEQAGYIKILQNLRDHNSVMQFPISQAAWYQDFIMNILLDSDRAREGCMPERVYITGQ